MKPQKIRILAIIAAAFCIIFAVSLTVFFFNTSNSIVGAITLTSGIIGIGLYVLVRVLTKEKKPPVVTESGEPTGDGEEPEAGDAEAEPEAGTPEPDTLKDAPDEPESENTEQETGNAESGNPSESEQDNS